MSAPGEGATMAADAGVAADSTRPYAPLVVFDFDHTLYDGDSGSHLVLWLIRRHWARSAAALLLSPLLLPLIAWLPTRRRAISVYLWIGTVGTHRRADMDRLIQEERAAGRDTNDRLLKTIRAVAHEEFDAAGGVSSTAT